MTFIKLTDLSNKEWIINTKYITYVGTTSTYNRSREPGVHPLSQPAVIVGVDTEFEDINGTYPLRLFLSEEESKKLHKLIDQT